MLQRAWRRNARLRSWVSGSMCLPCPASGGVACVLSFGNGAPRCRWRTFVPHRSRPGADAADHSSMPDGPGRRRAWRAPRTARVARVMPPDRLDRWRPTWCPLQPMSPPDRAPASRRLPCGSRARPHHSPAGGVASARPAFETIHMTAARTCLAGRRKTRGRSRGPVKGGGAGRPPARPQPPVSSRSDARCRSGWCRSTRCSAWRSCRCSC